MCDDSVVFFFHFALEGGVVEHASELKCPQVDLDVTTVSVAGMAVAEKVAVVVVVVAAEEVAVAEEVVAAAVVVVTDTGMLKMTILQNEFPSNSVMRELFFG